MLTTRGWWFALAAAALLVLGVVLDVVPAALVGLALTAWFLTEWSLFTIRVRTGKGRFHFVREVRDERGPVDSLWAGRSFETRIEVGIKGSPALPYVSAADLIPFDVEYISGANEADGRLAEGSPLRAAYRFRCRAAGQVRFEGVGIRLADLQGFFYHQAFLGQPLVLRVLPVLTEASKPGATAKRHNVLPPPGVHRLRRPGSGSELLDLRDYLPGDPPKTIAWKVSARRDRLITKEFESEVPVRCTLFVDTSNSVRIGPPGRNALGRLVEIAAVLLQANNDNRDLTGVCLFDERQAREIKPGRTPRHRSEVMNELADAAKLAPAAGSVNPEELIPVAHSFAEEVYPHLLRPEINRVPFWVPWLWNVPKYPKPRFSFGRYFFRLVFFLLSMIPLTVFLAVLLVVWNELHQWKYTRAFFSRPPSAGFFTAAGAFSLGYLLVVYLFLRCLPLLFKPRQRRMIERRKEMSALLSVKHGLAPGGVALLMEDNDRFAQETQHFLGEHHIPCPLALYDEHGRYLFAAPGKIDVLTAALLRAVARGHDNEMFVVLADLLELSDHFDPFLRAVRVALARHHQVVFICPWPPGLPRPEDDERKQKRRRRPATLRVNTQDDLYRLVRQMTEDRLHLAYRRLRQALTRMGVTVICAEDNLSAQLILDRMDRLRVAGIRR
jgi:uncharacterized protein (DUF58 family)